MNSPRALSVAPYLRVRDGVNAIAFYIAAFGAVERFRLVEPGGRLGHAELSIGDATLMISDEYPEHGIHGPATLGGTSGALHLEVDDAHAALARALAAGATLLLPVHDTFCGERSAKVRDPFGHDWLIDQHVEDVTPAEMQRRFTAMCEAGEL